MTACVLVCMLHCDDHEKSLHVFMTFILKYNSTTYTHIQARLKVYCVSCTSLLPVIDPGLLNGELHRVIIVLHCCIERCSCLWRSITKVPVTKLIVW